MYSTEDYVRDKLLSEGNSPAARDAKLRVQLYERGDVENATRLMNGERYISPYENTGCGKTVDVAIRIPGIVVMIIGLCLVFSGEIGAIGLIVLGLILFIFLPMW